MRFLAALGLALALSAGAQTMDEFATQRAQLEVDRVRSLVESGVLPRSRLTEAEEAVADARDEAILRRTLYGAIRIEELTEAQGDEMLAAAERIHTRQKLRAERMKELVEVGALPRMSLTPHLEQLDRAQRTLDLAQSRARLLNELAAMIEQEEAALSDPEAIAPGMEGLSERFDGDGVFRITEFGQISAEFHKKFARPLPVSAYGETAVHRSLGFNHRGRVDIALDPDNPEGRWLRGFLQSLRIPYFAFRGYVRGKSTGPHIHIGPPSDRIRSGG